MTPQDTMRLALEALEDSHQNINPERGFADELEKQIEAAIEALRSALAQQGEPETWIDDGGWEFPIEKPAAPAAQPDTWTDDGGWEFPIERQIIQTR